MAKKTTEDAGDVVIEMEEGETKREPTELEHAQANQALLTEQLRKLEARVERAEFSGGSKNRQRIWDEQNAHDENIRYASLPSFDGKDPIIDWANVPGGSVQERNGVVTDTQSWTTETLSGEKRRISVDEAGSLVSGNGIHVRINNWQDFRNEIAKIDKMKLKYQRSTRDMAAVDLRALRLEIEEKEKGVKVNVTLSEDLGKTFDGPTFDVYAKMLNAHR